MPIRLSDLRKTADASIGADGLDSAQVTTIAQASGLSYLSTLDSLPTSNLTSGDQAFVAANQRLYISNGTGWYNVSLINLTPQFDSDINSAFSIVDSQTPLIITNPASDSDNPDAIITYGGTLSDSGQYLIALTRDSSVWTFTPLSADSVHSNVTLGNIPDSAGGDFTYTFTATDGINTATKAVTITYDGLAAASIAGIGTISLYSFGTRANVTPSAIYQNKEVIVFASDARANQPGNLAESTYYAAAGGTELYGYVIGGVSPNRSPSYTGVVMRHTLANSGNMTNMPVQVPNSPHVQQTNSTPMGPGAGDYVYYLTGGYPNTNSIHKYGAAGDAPYVDVGDIAATLKQTATTNSATHGYVMGGIRTTPPYTFGNIEKFPFATDENATDVGDLAVNAAAGMGGITPTHGYHLGGFSGGTGSPPGTKNHIQKFPFASDGNASDVADMAETRYEGGAGQSQTHIYTVGGTGTATVADKTPYASDTNSTSIGSLATPRYQHVSASN